MSKRNSTTSPPLDIITRNRVYLVLVILLTFGIFAVDVFLLSGVILPSPPYFIPIILAAYLLTVRQTTVVAVLATVLRVLSDLSKDTPLWLLVFYFAALVLVSFLSIMLAARISHETALANERKLLLEQLEKEKQHADENAAESQHRAVELNAANEELEAFTYSVSHDLRAPLRHIDGFSQALLEDYTAKLDEQGKEYLRFVREGAQRMSQLIDDLLKLSRATRSEIHQQPVDLTEIASAFSAELRNAEPERKTEWLIQPNVMANGDARLLRIVLENLLENAWKFTSRCQQAQIEFGAMQDSGRYVYYVRDNGAGFDMAYADRLFIPFQRLHSTEEYPGTGIGLATVQRIIRRHGGRVWAEGEIGKGATFYFTLS